MNEHKLSVSAVTGLAIALLAIGSVVLAYLPTRAPQPEPQPEQPVEVDYKNITYTIEGQPVALVGGRAEAPAAPGSAEQVVTQYFGNEATGDVNGDGMPDVAFILTQSGGGSGTFYYVVVALKTATGYEGTNALLLGDRIAPQTTEIRDGQVLVNYADRAPGEPMTAQPSVGVSKYFEVQGATLVEHGSL